MKSSLKSTWPLILLILSVALSCGCRQRIAGVFAMADLEAVHRMAVFGLSPEHEQIFMANYLQIFREQSVTFVARNDDLYKIMDEQDLLRDDNGTPTIDEGRLDEKTRARIKQILGVEALVLCRYYESPKGSQNMKFLVRIINTETGAIVGSAITEARDHFQYHSYTAVKKIHDYLDYEDRRTYNSRYQSPY